MLNASHVNYIVDIEINETKVSHLRFIVSVFYITISNLHYTKS